MEAWGEAAAPSGASPRRGKAHTGAERERHLRTLPGMGRRAGAAPVSEHRGRGGTRRGPRFVGRGRRTGGARGTADRSSPAALSHLRKEQVRRGVSGCGPPWCARLVARALCAHGAVREIRKEDLGSSPMCSAIACPPCSDRKVADPDAQDDTQVSQRAGPLPVPEHPSPRGGGISSWAAGQSSAGGLVRQTALTGRRHSSGPPSGSVSCCWRPPSPES